MKTSKSADLRDKCAIVGIGETNYSKNSGRSNLALGLEAALKAIEDAGLTVKDIDGIVPGFIGPTVKQYASNLGIDQQIKFTVNPSIGGASQGAGIQAAAAAIYAGIATNVLCVFAFNGASSRGRISRTDRMVNPGMSATYRRDFELPYGFKIPAQWFALICKRHMHEFGTTSRQLGAVAVTLRKHASLNDKARYRTPISIEDHQNSPMIVDPFHLLDFSMETDGGAAVLVTSSERARNARHRPVYIMGIGEGHYFADDVVNKPDFFGTGHREAAHRAFAMAGVTTRDIDVAEIYDGFTFHVISHLEEIGFCKRGEGGPFVEEGHIGLDGDLPTTTHGGCLSHAHLSGMSHIVEAVRQTRGEAGRAQVKDAEIVLVNTEGNVGDATVIILRR